MDRKKHQSLNTGNRAVIITEHVSPLGFCLTSFFCYTWRFIPVSHYIEIVCSVICNHTHCDAFIPSYLGCDRAAVRCGCSSIEVVLGQQERRAGHVQKRVIHQNHLTEVELVGEALAFSFVQNAFVVVVPAGWRTTENTIK